jgi:hypothetical protein
MNGWCVGSSDRGSRVLSLGTAPKIDQYLYGSIFELASERSDVIFGGIDGQYIFVLFQEIRHGAAVEDLTGLQYRPQNIHCFCG